MRVLCVSGLTLIHSRMRRKISASSRLGWKSSSKRIKFVCSEFLNQSSISAGSTSLSGSLNLPEAESHSFFPWVELQTANVLFSSFAVFMQIACKRSHSNVQTWMTGVFAFMFILNSSLKSIKFSFFITCGKRESFFTYI